MPIERAVRSTAEAIAMRNVTAAEAVAMLRAALGTDAAPAEATPRERLAAARQATRAQMLDEMARHGGPAAATETAKKFAIDPLDPLEVESLARKLRRWRRRKTDTCPNLRPAIR